METDGKAMECSFRSLKFVNAMYVGEGTKVPVPKLFEITHSSIKQVPSKGVQVRKGLGKRLQGMLRSIAIIQKKDRFDLRYKPDRRGRQRFFEKKKEKRIASFLKKEKESAKMEIPPLSHTFRSASFINPRAIWSREKEMSTDIDKAFGSLSIDIVEVEDLEEMSTRLPLFPR